ncbi:hypothetical protein V6N11_058273 [Hibiscus sabdariffa]|uniref:Uncharacterized protein n=1 Tax=Hibiscus sabdariffa TaxID=183260 RepID=A0ABR2A1L4_9ROSI
MNEAYKKSYPDKKLKVQGKEVRQPVVEDQVATITSHQPGIRVGNHAAVHIQEQGDERRHSARVGVSKFVDRLEGALDKLSRGNREQENFVPMVSDDDSLWIDSQLEEEGDFDAHFHDVGTGDQ